MTQWLASSPHAQEYSKGVANHVNIITKPSTSQNDDWPRALEACTRGIAQVTHEHLVLAPQARMCAVATSTRLKQCQRKIVLLVGRLAARYALPAAPSCV